MVCPHGINGVVGHGDELRTNCFAGGLDAAARFRGVQTWIVANGVAAFDGLLDPGSQGLVDQMANGELAIIDFALDS